MLPTRQQLIQGQKWKTQRVETTEGAFLVAAPSYAGSMRFAEASKRQARLDAEVAGNPAVIPADATTRTQVETFAVMLVEGLVSEDGAPLLSTVDEARQALESISNGTLMRLMQAFTELTRGDLSGNSGAGPSAGSPSSSAGT